MVKRLRILIVDDDCNMVRTLKDIFMVKGCPVETAYSGFEALKKARDENFDCVITDIKMPKMNGVEFYLAVKSIKPELPVVLMTAYSTDKLVKKGLEEGAISVLAKPLDINTILFFFSTLQKERSVAIVDDNLNFCKTLRDILQKQGFVVSYFTNYHNLIENLKPDCQVMLLDMKINKISGLDVLRKVRKKYPQLPVVLITAHREEMSSKIKTALEISAYTCLYKPLQIERLFKVLSEIHHKQLSMILKQSVGKKK